MPRTVADLPILIERHRVTRTWPKLINHPLNARHARFISANFKEGLKKLSPLSSFGISLSELRWVGRVPVHSSPPRALRRYGRHVTGTKAKRKQPARRSHSLGTNMCTTICVHVHRSEPAAVIFTAKPAEPQSRGENLPHGVSRL